MLRNASNTRYSDILIYIVLIIFFSAGVAASQTFCCNTSLGTGAFTSNTTGYLNTAIGSQALQANTTGNTNTAIGS